MKKLIFALLLIAALLVSCGEMETSGESMYIQAAELSKETETILKALAPDAVLFDYCVDDSVTQANISVWVCEGGEWSVGAQSTASINDVEGRYAFCANEDGSFDIIVLTDSGHIQSAQDDVVDFSVAAASSTMSISSRQTIVPGEEIVLWVKFGWDTDEARNSAAMLRDFAEVDCAVGAAVTVVFE